MLVVVEELYIARGGLVTFEEAFPRSLAKIERMFTVVCIATFPSFLPCEVTHLNIGADEINVFRNLFGILRVRQSSP